jgi:adenylate cyclase
VRRSKSSCAGIEATPTFHGNTVEHVVATGDWLDLRLDRGQGQEFPVTRDLACEGITHYLMAPLVFGDGSKGATSWSTRHPDGFAAAQAAGIRALAGLFALAFEARELRRGLECLLGSYVGTDPARRILAGTVQRGDVCRINAAIMLTDMRGYTRLSERLDERELVEQLNAHFDCIVPAVREAGGEILKFTGDGVLAVFDAASIDGAPNRAALQAALAAIASLNIRNASASQSRPIRMGIALHVGEVAYGNIGSGDRLDFTAIGRDVNLTSRLERFCKPLNRSPLMTSAFVEGLSEPVVSLGHRRFRSFDALQEIYGLPMVPHQSSRRRKSPGSAAFDPRRTTTGSPRLRSRAQRDNAHALVPADQGRHHLQADR